MFDHRLEMQFDSDAFVMDYIRKNNKVLIPYINHEMGTIYGIDLTKLPEKPVNIRYAFVKWLIKVNEPRLKKGQNILVTYDIVKLCPLWKVFPMPFKALKLEKINKPMKPQKTIGTTPTVKPRTIGSQDSNKQQEGNS